MSWATAFKAVQDAIDDASLVADADTPCGVWVTEGVYYVYALNEYDTISLRPFVRVLGGFQGTETNVEARNWTLHPAVLDGRLGPGETVRVLHVVTGSDDAILDGFTIAHGAANRSSGSLDDMAGGGMSNSSTSPTIMNCVFEENEAVGASNSGGGAISNSYSASPMIIDCVFRNNTTSGNGGAIRSQDNSPVVVSGTLFEGNSASNGGAIWSAVDSPAAIDGCVFRGNHAEGDGGAINLWNMTSTIVNTVLVRNDGGHMGGAIRMNAGVLRIAGCSFYGNFAEMYGGGAVHLSGPASMVAVNTIFWGDIPNEVELIETAAADVTYSVIPSFPSGEGNIAVDPLYLDADVGDLHLDSSSPCVDAANGYLATEFDADGNARVDDPSTPNTGVGDPPYADMGAFEYME